MKRAIRASNWAIPLSVVLCAFALRIYRLGGPSLHGDEAFSAQFVGQSWRQVFAALGSYEPNPPFYYLSLKPWLALVGTGEFPLRYLSAWWGVLLAPWAYDLGRQMHNKRQGAIAALLATISPFLVWHSQEARMYAPLATLSLASMALLVRARKTRRPALWRLWAAASWLALFTHYFAAFLIAAQVGWMMFEWLRSDRRAAPLRAWALPLALAALLYLPWAVYVAPAMLAHEKSWMQSLSLGELGRRLFLTFSLGSTASTWATHWLWPGFLLLLAIGSLALLRRRQAGLMGACLLAPPAIVYLLSLRRPMFHERYLIVLAPLYLLLLAAGVTAWANWLQRRFRPSTTAALAAAPLAFLLAAAGLSLVNYFYAPQHAKSPPWRELGQYVQAHSATGDLVIQNYPDPSLSYYLPQELAYALAPRNAPFSQAEVTEALSQLLDRHQRLWLVPTQSPDWDATGLVQTWLDRHADLIQTHALGDLRLRLYLSPPALLGDDPPLARLGQSIQLRGFRLDHETGPLLPGDTLHLSLYWQTDAPLTVGYTVFTHLLDPAGQLRGQQDNPPLDGSYPTSAWLPGELLVDRYAIPLSPDAPPGAYHLAVGLYDAATLDRLPVHDIHCPNCAAPAYVSDNRLFLPVEIPVSEE
ncbi:MAG: glycosyltransferase family 39 protein [Chloroflexota bacterium]